jgi:uncharacterized protein YbaR (Trm112 family)
MSVELDPTLLEILACPQCHSNLIVDYEASEMICSSFSCALAYPVRDGIPIMLGDEARHPASVAPTAAAAATPPSGSTSPADPVAAADPAVPSDSADQADWSDQDDPDDLDGSDGSDGR